MLILRYLQLLKPFLLSNLDNPLGFEQLIRKKILNTKLHDLFEINAKINYFFNADCASRNAEEHFFEGGVVNAHEFWKTLSCVKNVEIVFEMVSKFGTSFEIYVKFSLILYNLSF